MPRDRGPTSWGEYGRFCKRLNLDERQEPQAEPWAAWRADAQRSSAIELKPLLYEIYLLAGLAAYLDRQYGAAIAFFESAAPHTPPRGFVVVEGRIPTGAERVISAARQQRALTPQEVFQGDAKAQLILQLADIYLEAEQWHKAMALSAMVIEGAQFRTTPLQKSWAHRQRANAIYGLFDGKNARSDYLLSHQTAPQAPWAARSLFNAASITINFHQDKQRAAAEFEAVVAAYPRSEFAERSAYFACFLYEADKQWDKALRAYTRFLERYPDSQWAGTIRRYHLPNVEKHIEPNRRNPR